MTQNIIDIKPLSSVSSDEKIQRFKKSYLDCYGLYSLALKESGITQEDLNEYLSDLDWKLLSEEASMLRDDWVESKLLDLIESGDVTATIFYCSSKMKDRGYRK